MTRDARPWSGAAAARIFAANDRLNQIVIGRIAPAAWDAKPPGRNVRTISAIFAHLHNVRVKWVRLTAPHLKAPGRLHRARCTPRRACAALAASAARCAEMLAGASGAFRRDGWARPWPAGPEMLCYMIAHEAHHRGQVCMLAQQLGCPLPKPVTARLWNWEGLLKPARGAGLSGRRGRGR